MRGRGVVRSRNRELPGALSLARHTVFRDLKPARLPFASTASARRRAVPADFFQDNVVIDEAHHALLTDFGLSKARDSEHL